MYFSNVEQLIFILTAFWDLIDSVLDQLNPNQNPRRLFLNRV